MPLTAVPDAPPVEAEHSRVRFLVDVPPRYQRAEPSVPEVAEWVDGAVHGSPHGLFLLGPTGTGKTYQAYGALIGFRAAFEGVLPTERPASRAFDLIDLLRDLRPDGDPGAFDRAVKTPLVMFDDLGVGKHTDWSIEQTYAIVNRRYNALLPSIWTSNYSLKQLADLLGDRLVSRLAGSSVMVTLSGADRRRGV